MTHVIDKDTLVEEWGDRIIGTPEYIYRALQHEELLDGTAQSFNAVDFINRWRWFEMLSPEYILEQEAKGKEPKAKEKELTVEQIKTFLIKKSIALGIETELVGNDIRIIPLGEVDIAAQKLVDDLDETGYQLEVRHG